jgi:hypothetical protein
MISSPTQAQEDLASEVAAMMLEARALILRGVATCEQCTDLVIDILGCEDIEELRFYVREEIQCLVAH